MDYNYLAKILFSAIKIPIAFYNLNHVLELEYSYKRFVIPSCIRKEIILPLLLKNKTSDLLPLVRMGGYGEVYISMALFSEPYFLGTIVLGPFLNKKMCNEEIDSQLAKQEFGSNGKEELEYFYGRLRVISDPEIRDIACHLHYYFYHNILLPETIDWALPASEAMANRLPNNTPKQTQPFLEQPKNDATSKIISTCKKYILTHTYNDINLKNLSELVFLNPSYLSRLFKAQIGMSITEYSKHEKIEEAKILIEKNVLSLSDISNNLGFYDYNHFVKVFKSVTGTTPNQYRRYNTRKLVESR